MQSEPSTTSHFAVYMWNAAPVDSTNMARSYAAMDREFPFPIETRLDVPSIVEGASGGQATLEYVEAAVPLLRKQKEVL